MPHPPYSGRMGKYQRKWRMGRKGLLYSLGLCTAILAIGGLGFWALEPQAHSLSDGLWLAFTTAATVGYGDIVPSTHWSRAFAVVVVLLGLAVLSLVTASVAAMLVEVEERKVESDLLHELRSLRAEVQDLRRMVSAVATRPLSEGNTDFVATPAVVEPNSD
jgi:voltage-gated potassium channel